MCALYYLFIEASFSHPVRCESLVHVYAEVPDLPKLMESCNATSPRQPRACVCTYTYRDSIIDSRMRLFTYLHVDINLYLSLHMYMYPSVSIPWFTSIYVYKINVIVGA